MKSKGLWAVAVTSRTEEGVAITAHEHNGRTTSIAAPAGLELFARCAGGFEHVLAGELKRLGAAQVRPLQGGVSFAGGLDVAYRACLFCRSATRIQVVLGRVDAASAQAFYDGVHAIAWEEVLRADATLAVRAYGTNAQLRNTQFSALKAKDAICDRLREVRGSRPNIDVDNPGFALEASVHSQRATLYANLSGESLHKRGYRRSGVQVTAPLKETLAAGMLLAAGWQDLACVEQCAFVDPMCGSGTLAIEAALMAAGIAPGLQHAHWGFEGWLGHDAQVWERVSAEAGQLRKDAAAPLPLIVACDTDPQAVEIARACAQRAGVEDNVRFFNCDATDLAETLQREGITLPPQGLLASNPPYGKRLGSPQELGATYEALSGAIDMLPRGWSVCLISSDEGIDAALGRSARTHIPCCNGPVEATVRLYEAGPSTRTQLSVTSLDGVGRTVSVARMQSEQFAARLRKVAKERARWARKNSVSCYRLYDADLPDYACAIDLYTEAGSGQARVRISEYQAPAEIDPQLAAARISDVLSIVPAVLDLDPGRIACKVRRKAKGGGQYREALGRPDPFQVQEGPYTFEVDLAGHMDTGLFLDHRITREMLGGMAAGKRFANLFGYTGAASVWAAGGGATETTTVDMSGPYLAWAQRNMALNGFTGPEHAFVQEDVLGWLERNRRASGVFDLVFCDPPTFSNSKSMGQRSFSVQRDHARLLALLHPLVDGGGQVVFSCNLRNFRLDLEAVSALGYAIEDISARTIPHDFERSPKIHHCFVLTKG